MTWKKGTSGNPGGRKPGTTNKVTGDLRAFFDDFIRQNAARMQADYNKLSSRDRVLFIEKLSKYVLPTMQSVSLESDLDRLPDNQVDELLQRLTENLNLNDHEKP